MADADSLAKKIAEEIQSHRLSGAMGKPPSQHCATSQRREFTKHETTKGEAHRQTNTAKSAESSIVSEKYSLVQKLMMAMNDSDFSNFLFWNETGDEIQIVDAGAFATRVLPTYFDRSSFGPFVKELLRWGFHRQPPSGNGIKHAFAHTYFRRDDPKLISLIVPPKGQPNAKASASAIKNVKKMPEAAPTRKTKPDKGGSKQTSVKKVDVPMHASIQKEGGRSANQYRREVSNSSPGNDKTRNESRSSGHQALPVYEQHSTKSVTPPSISPRSSPAYGSSSSLRSNQRNGNLDPSERTAQSLTSEPFSQANHSTMNTDVTDQEYALRITEGGGGLSNSDINAQQQALALPGHSGAEQGLCNTIFPMNSLQNPFEDMNGLNPLNNPLQSMNVQGNNISGFNQLNGNLQGLQNSQPQQHSQVSMSPTHMSTHTTSTTTPNNPFHGAVTMTGPSQLSADINAAIEKEVARRLDNIMSIAANIEIMREQARATAQYRTAAAKLGAADAEQEYQNHSMGQHRSI